MNRKKRITQLIKRNGFMFKYAIMNTVAGILSIGGSKKTVKGMFAQLEKICDENNSLSEANVKISSELEALRLSVSDLTDSNKTLHDLSNEFRTRYDALRSFLKEFHPENLTSFDAFWDMQKALRMNAMQDEIENVGIPLEINGKKVVAYEETGRKVLVPNNSTTGGNEPPRLDGDN